MRKKYELTNEKIDIGTDIFYRVRALKNFHNVKAGDLGGCVESEANLSHYGNCWISTRTYVYGNARIYGDAYVSGIAIYGNSWTMQILNTMVSGNARIYGDAKVYGCNWIGENAHIYGNAYICGNGSMRICGNIKLNHGTWSQCVKINGMRYLLSPTLEKISVGDRMYE